MLEKHPSSLEQRRVCFYRVRRRRQVLTHIRRPVTRKPELRTIIGQGVNPVADRVGVGVAVPLGDDEFPTHP